MPRHDPIMSPADRIPAGPPIPRCPAGPAPVPFGIRFAVSPTTAGKHEKTYYTQRTIEKTVNTDDGTRSEDSITVDREKED